MELMTGIYCKRHIIHDYSGRCRVQRQYHATLADGTRLAIVSVRDDDGEFIARCVRNQYNLRITRGNSRAESLERLFQSLQDTPWSYDSGTCYTSTNYGTLARILWAEGVMQDAQED